MDTIDIDFFIVVFPPPYLTEEAQSPYQEHKYLINLDLRKAEAE
jgi:hypothetical protein